MSLVWKTEDEMCAELKKIEEIRDYDNYGYDGNIQAATGEFEYKGIKYIINVMRYYVLANSKRGDFVSKFTPMSRRSSEYFANLEYSDSCKELISAIKIIREYTEFLYCDSLHSYADTLDIDEQIVSMIDQAKRDIDSIKDYLILADTKIKDLEAAKMLIAKVVGDMQ